MPEISAANSVEDPDDAVEEAFQAIKFQQLAIPNTVEGLAKWFWASSILSYPRPETVFLSDRAEDGLE